MTLQLFTIVQNGMPFITRHIARFQRLKIPWQWHIVEGPVQNVCCTDWCNKFPVLQMKRHRLSHAWCSVDGTAEYLDTLQGLNHSTVSVYRCPRLWRGKLEMCNEPLGAYNIGDIIHEVDVDEFWTTKQLETIYAFFRDNPGVGQAWYWCRYFMGPRIVVTNRVKPANERGQAWIRTHRFAGRPWTHHEPPRIDFPGRPAPQEETERLGLVFDHKAYVEPKQVRFKEHFYRMPDAYQKWKAIQRITHWPARLHDYWPWADPTAMIDKATKNL